MNHHIDNKAVRYLIPGILLISLLFLAFMVLRDFLLPLTWALIIAYVMWPPYRLLRRRLKNRNTASAAAMTTIIAVLFSLTVYWLAGLLQNELTIAYQSITGNLADKNYRLPDFIHSIPWLGNYLQELIDRLSSDRAGLTTQFAQWAKQWLGDFAKFLGGIGQYIIKLGVILVTLFFCFRDGDKAAAQLHDGLVRFLGEYQHVYLQAAGQTIRAVVYGLVLAAFGQGVLAGFGYAVAGVKAPVLFGAVTFLLAMVPMGATLIWMPLSLGLILTDQLWPGIGLFLWGLLVVSTVDNIIRPLIISGSSQVPFLVVMFGVLGGLSAFGAVGLFLGPVILAVLLAVWQAWINQQRQA